MLQNAKKSSPARQYRNKRRVQRHRLAFLLSSFLRNQEIVHQPVSNVQSIYSAPYPPALTATFFEGSPPVADVSILGDTAAGQVTPRCFSGDESAGDDGRDSPRQDCTPCLRSAENCLHSLDDIDRQEIVFDVPPALHGSDEDTTLTCPCLSSEPCALYEALHTVLSDMSLPLACCYHHLGNLDCVKATGRQRDIYPLPLVNSWELNDGDIFFSDAAALSLLNGCIAALNLMIADLKCCSSQPCVRSRPTKAQAAVHDHLRERCARFLREISKHSGGNFTYNSCYSDFEQKPSSKYPKMKADDVDLPLKAATCDSAKLVPADLYATVSSPSELFSKDLINTLDLPGPRGPDRSEYLKLVLKQLSCGKTRLRTHVAAVGDGFSVSKPSGKQREVWDGSAPQLPCCWQI